MHAVVCHSGAVLLQLCRYSASSKHPQKDANRLATQPGEVIRLPIFCSEHDASVRQESFVVGAIAIHLGNKVH